METRLDIETRKICENFVVKFGQPPIHGIFPSLKLIFDMWIFFFNLKEKYQIKDFDDEFNINMNFYIDERLEFGRKQSYIVYGIDQDTFYDKLNKYRENGTIDNNNQSNDKEMEERIHELEENEVRDKFRDECTKLYKDTNKDKDFCVICGDTDKLITVVNYDHKENSKLCNDCIQCQKNVHKVKFSKIKNGKTYIMHPK